MLLKCALRHEKDKALQTLTKQKREILWKDPEGPWLERAVARGWANYPLFSRIDPFLANIRGEDRFQKLMERIKRDWENFEV
ncbi:MAG: hypothetical protein A2V45_01085 [Candidatus Aminicenantes bacterium RBG_19FT_COMBO_58_17]|nr:MAG: hypothetical protein A2V45_01085 [Candidatus Aminicenantes bacterium RBG_19FT_COMBO_58_17]